MMTLAMTLLACPMCIPSLAQSLTFAIVSGIALLG
jgi:hypothetical protein